MTTVSVRLSQEEIEKIRTLSKKEKKEKSAVMRELIRQGFIYKSMQEYREGRKSLGTLAKDLELSLSATIDLLAELGIASPLTHEDYLQSLETLRQIQ